MNFLPPNKLKQPGGMLAFLLVWIGQIISVLGSNMTAFGLSIWIYQQTKSATDMAIDAGGLHYPLPDPFSHCRRYGGPVQPQADDDGERPGRWSFNGRAIDPVRNRPHAVLVSVFCPDHQWHRQYFQMASLFSRHQYHDPERTVRARKRNDVAAGCRPGCAGSVDGRRASDVHKNNRHHVYRRINLYFCHRSAADRICPAARKNRGWPRKARAIF